MSRFVHLISFATLSLALIVSSIGCSTKNQEPQTNTIAIISDCDRNLVQRVSSFVANELSTTPTLHTMTTKETSAYTRNPSEFVRAFSKKYSIGIILLDRQSKMPDSAKTKDVTNIAVLSVGLLKQKSNDDETLGRRVETETMRQVGKLIGMNDCPVILCAMFKTTNQPDLDAKARNFCPPCAIKAAELLKAKGLVKPE